MDTGPAFGQADLTNCEREQIHLAGSIQPNGLLLVLREADGSVLQASDNLGAGLGLGLSQLVGSTLAVLGGNVLAQVSALAAEPAPAALAEPRPLTLHTETAIGLRRMRWPTTLRCSTACRPRCSASVARPASGRFPTPWPARCAS